GEQLESMPSYLCDHPAQIWVSLSGPSHSLLAQVRLRSVRRQPRLESATARRRRCRASSGHDPVSWEGPRATIARNPSQFGAALVVARAISAPCFAAEDQDLPFLEMRRFRRHLPGLPGGVPPIYGSVLAFVVAGTFAAFHVRIAGFCFC